MPDREKVIKGLETIKLFFGYGLPSTAEIFDSYYGTLNDAIALLKEQEATTFKPHYIDTYSKHFICGVECGSCHKEISSTYHYCPHCGKAVKWE